jgi:nucleotide-binding universal stress UspA family protein
MAFHRVLAAVDFSPPSVAAARAAGETAQFHSAKLLVFHSVEVDLDAADATLELLEKARAAMEVLVEDLSSVLNGVEVITEITSGWPEDAIIDKARDWKADLVVLGANGTETLEEVLLGGVASGVVERAPCSVMVTRGQ